MKRGQVWIETVIYTLVGLVLIGLVLGLATPKINEYRDRATIDQTIEALRVMDQQIEEVSSLGAGNVRSLDFTLDRGQLTFDGENNQIFYEMNDSRVLYSESGVETSIGKIKLLSIEGNKKNTVRMVLNYDSDLRIMSTGGEIASKTFTQAPTPYRFTFEHAGYEENNGIFREVIEVRELG